MVERRTYARTRVPFKRPAPATALFAFLAAATAADVFGFAGFLAAAAAFCLAAGFTAIRNPSARTTLPTVAYPGVAPGFRPCRGSRGQLQHPWQVATCRGL